jgi:hypothetical protein
MHSCGGGEDLKIWGYSSHIWIALQKYWTYLKRTIAGQETQTSLRQRHCAASGLVNRTVVGTLCLRRKKK